jgi:hypothetical protein
LIVINGCCRFESEGVFADRRQPIFGNVSALTTSKLKPECDFDCDSRFAADFHSYDGLVLGSDTANVCCAIANDAKVSDIA